MRLTRWLVGVALLPTAALLVFAAFKCLALLAARSSAAAPFVAGFGLSTALWLVARAAESERGLAGLVWSASSRAYVFGHELTHALAAWSLGAKVHGFRVGETGGHVDLSESNAFIALAPYCVPLYLLLVIAGWRAALWLKPAAAAGAGPALFLILAGGALAFHILKTLEVLLTRSQPDLAAAGGTVFSVSWIALANGLFILVLAKALFPRSVHAGSELWSVAASSKRFWLGVWAFLSPLKSGFVAQLKRS